MSKRITEYLLERRPDLKDMIRGDRFNYEDCFKSQIKTLFDIEVSCEHYGSVINGEGNEKEKIDSVYSSSLQSLLIFSQVSTKRPIYIDNIPYTKVCFEHKNKVIGYPSSVDVLLTNEDGNILFIESKLYEIIYTSTENKGTPEIGPTYFSKSEMGYKKLGLKDSDLTKIGIDLSVIGEDLYKQSASDIKAKIAGPTNKDGKTAINPIEPGGFVYSYGIKQILSHIIGILNSIESDNESLEKPKVKFLCLYNELPKYEEEEARGKLNAYKKHEDIVYETIKDKKELAPVIINPLYYSYQDLFMENKDKRYFDGMEKIIRFYHLDGE